MRPQDFEVIPQSTRLKRKKDRKPLGIAMVLGGLLFMASVSYLVTPERQKWVMTDFKSIQGTYMGIYFHKGRQYVCVKTEDGMEAIEVDKGVRFAKSIPVGSRVDVAYQATDTQNPRLVRGEDIKNVYIPDNTTPGEATRY
jgi:hypothetical protein